MRFLILATFLVSCSTATYQLNNQNILPYKEESTITKIDFKHKPIKIGQIKDLRKDLSIGYAYTGVNYHKTPIIVSNSLQSFVSEQVENLFDMRDILLSENANLTLDIDVKDIQVSEVIEKYKPERAKCRVELDFHLLSDGDRWEGSFWTEYLSAGDLSDGTERLEPTLASCFNQVIEKLVNDNNFKNFIK